MLSGGSESIAEEESNESRMYFAPSAEEVARRAYFSFVNQGSIPGQDVQHWLEAESELLAERNLTRVHGFHHDQSQSRIHRQPPEEESIFESVDDYSRGSAQNV